MVCSASFWVFPCLQYTEASLWTNINISEHLFNCYCCHVFLKETFRRDGRSIFTSLFIFCSEWYQLNNNIYNSQHYPLSFSAYLVGLKLIIASNFNLWTIRVAHFNDSVLNFDTCILPCRYYNNQVRDCLPQTIKIFVPLSHQSVTPFCCCCSVAKSCPTLGDHTDYSMPGPPVLDYLQSLIKFVSIELVMLSNHLILCHLLFLLPSIFPSIRVFSNELSLCIRWSNY